MECYRITPWEMFQENHGDDIDGFTQCITDYIRFCEGCVVPTKKNLLLHQQQTLGHRDIKGIKEECFHGRGQQGC